MPRSLLPDFVAKRLSSLRLSETATEALNQAILRWVVNVLKRDGGPIHEDYALPLGDPGLFGPDSVTWRIHADFPGMMAGGIAALMLQTLHPLALAGVWDHSNFREDLIGRLRRTTAFVAATTYAPAEVALTQIDRIRRIHEHVRGHAPDGRPYSANDPALLTWVHVTEMASFLRGYEVYRGPVPDEIADRYFAETVRIAEALGARNVPASRAEIKAYFRHIQPELIFSDRSRELLAILAAVQLPIPVPAVSRELFLGAGAALLPDWANTRMARTNTQRLRASAAAQVLKQAGPLLRAALVDGISAQSCRRMEISPGRLAEWP